MYASDMQYSPTLIYSLPQPSNRKNHHLLDNLLKSTTIMR